MTELSFRLTPGEQHVPQFLSLQLSKCWLLHGEMRCAIKANLSLYSCVNPAMFNQPRSCMAAGWRDKSREASIHTRSEGRAFHRALNSTWKKSKTLGRPRPAVWFLTLESVVLKSLWIQKQSLLSGGVCNLAKKRESEHEICISMEKLLQVFSLFLVKS